MLLLLISVVALIVAFSDAHPASLGGFVPKVCAALQARGLPCNLPAPPGSKRSLEQPGPPDDKIFTVCNATSESLSTWNQYGGTTTLFLGNWEGSLYVTVNLDTNPITPLLQEVVLDHWNVTYLVNGGYIQWIDTLNNTLTPDHFKRYLVRPGPGYQVWTQCSDVSQSQTSNFFDFEMNPQHLTSQTSILTQNVAPFDTGASCIYLISNDGNTVRVNCMNLAPLGLFPPGITANYYQVMTKR